MTQSPPSAPPVPAVPPTPPAAPEPSSGTPGTSRRWILTGVTAALLAAPVGLRVWSRLPVPEPATTPIDAYFAGRSPVHGSALVETDSIDPKSWGVTIHLDLEPGTDPEDAITLLQDARRDLVDATKDFEHTIVSLMWTSVVGDDFLQDGVLRSGDLLVSIDVDLARTDSSVNLQYERLRAGIACNGGDITSVSVPLELDQPVGLGLVSSTTVVSDDLPMAPPAAPDGTALSYEARTEVGATKISVESRSDVDLSGVPVAELLAALPTEEASQGAGREPWLQLRAISRFTNDNRSEVEISEPRLTVDEAC